jgi:hypothetical protein
MLSLVAAAHFHGIVVFIACKVAQRDHEWL